MIDFRTNVLRNYGVDAELRDRGLSTDAVDAELHAQAVKWATGFDANALIVLRRCATKFDAKPQVANIAAPLLYVLATTDNLFGPELGEQTIAHIHTEAGVEAIYFELDSPYGHRAPSVDWDKWGGTMSAFLDKHAIIPS